MSATVFVFTVALKLLKYLMKMNTKNETRYYTHQVQAELRWSCSVPGAHQACLSQTHTTGSIHSMAPTCLTHSLMSREHHRLLLQKAC